MTKALWAVVLVASLITGVCFAAAYWPYVVCPILVLLAFIVLWGVMADSDSGWR